MTVTADGWAGTPPASDPLDHYHLHQGRQLGRGQTITFTFGNVESSGPTGQRNVATLAPSDLGDDAPCPLRRRCRWQTRLSRATSS